MATPSTPASMPPAQALATELRGTTEAPWPLQPLLPDFMYPSITSVTNNKLVSSSSEFLSLFLSSLILTFKINAILVATVGIFALFLILLRDCLDFFQSYSVC